MNLKEKQMLDILKRGKEEYGIVATKAEFEAEGTRTDELLRLVEITRKADLKITLKIGGCESIRDLMESKQIGVDYLVAPMVETSYALSKFIDAKNKVYSKEEQEDTKFYINLETDFAYQNLSSIMNKAKCDNGIDGLVFGRCDFVMSKGGSGLQDINEQYVTDAGCNISSLCKNSGLEFIVGGGVSKDALDVIRKMNSVHLTRYETRKICFSGDSINYSNVEQALLNAVQFELLWLKNKRDYYDSIFHEDDARINMLESRWIKLQNS